MFIFSYDLLQLNLEKISRTSFDRINSQSVLSLTVQGRKREDQMNTFANIG